MSSPEFNNQILYKAQSGKLSTWRITVSQLEDGSAVYLSYSAKVLGGKEKETRSEVTVGKQNRTPYEQALSEASSKYLKQLRKGYTVEKPDPNARPVNTLGHPIAVKAQKWLEVKHKPPYLVSRKLDGHHMTAALSENGNVELYSMNSKLINLPHISNELQKALDEGHWDGLPLDGELYKHGLELDEIKSLAAGNKPTSDTLEFHIYDIMYFKDAYGVRLMEVGNVIKHTSDVIQGVETIRVESADEVQPLHDQFINEFYEGSMIRWGAAGYGDSARSQYVLKKKDYIDEEFKIVSHTYGKPKFAEVDGVKVEYQVPILILEGRHGKLFKATHHGTMAEKHQAHLDGLEKRYGEMYTVKFFKFNKSGAPSQPVGLRYRNDL